MAGFTHRFDATTLREYDIRGIVGRTLHGADAFAIGRVFGSIVAEGGGRRVAVGRDGRLSSPELETHLVAGLVASGMEVVRIGCGPTPMLYFAAFDLPADGAVMLTGSHNPPDYNGFKMMLGKKPFFGAAIQELGRRAAEGRVVPEARGAGVPEARGAGVPEARGAGVPEARGSARETDVSEAYITRMMQDHAGGPRALTVVWDPGNGSGGAITERLVQRLPGTHHVINAAIDGTFPNHHPDPTVAKNLAQIIAKVHETGADLGIAFDGDADRIGVVDGRGRMMFGDQLLLVLARDVLKTHPGATIIADVKASQVLFDEVAKAGGRPLMWKTGHSLIKQKMAETGAPLAGEMSGHTFYADRWYGFDDALYTAVRLLDILARSDASLAEMHDAMPKVLNTPELRFDCAEDRKFAVVEEVRARLAAAGAEVSAVDGVRVSTPDGWWLLRASNTQAVLVARAEAASAAGLARLKAQLVAELAASGLEAPDFSGDNAGH